MTEATIVTSAPFGDAGTGGIDGLAGTTPAPDTRDHADRPPGVRRADDVVGGPDAGASGHAAPGRSPPAGTARSIRRCPEFLPRNYIARRNRLRSKRADCCRCFGIASGAETRRIAVQSVIAEGKEARTATLEAFADTIVPGEKRSPDDRAVAGAAEGGGAVAAGAITLLEMPEGGWTPLLDDLAVALDAHATTYQTEHGLEGDDTVPPFVALASADRVALVEALTRPGHPEKVTWTGLALFCNMAFDTGAHLHTTEALEAGHPGLVAIGYRKPDADGLWRFSDFSYRRPLARLHPDTDPTTGSLA